MGCTTRCLSILLSVFVLYAKASPIDDMAFRFRIAVSDSDNGDSFNIISRTFPDEPANPAAVSFDENQETTSFTDEINDLALRLQLALNNPENDPQFNEIRDSLDSKPVKSDDMVPIKKKPTKAPITQAPTTAAPTTTQAPTTEAPTTKAPIVILTRTNSDSAAEGQLVNALVRRRMMSFLSSWMQIRHLLRLAN